jgi:hypothetical protein
VPENPFWKFHVLSADEKQGTLLLTLPRDPFCKQSYFCNLAISPFTFSQNY